MLCSTDHALAIAVDAAKSAGQILRDMLETATVHEKAPKDFVTDADLAAQVEIEKRITTEFPSHVFLGEESMIPKEQWQTLSQNDYCWLVDPLDGTTNYLHRFPNFAVSIALVQRHECLLGVVFDPMANELFTATRGGGAYMNGREIHSSGIDRLCDAMVAVSFPPEIHRESPEIQQFVEVLIQSQSVRRLGSAALNLCYVANGRLDAYWANKLKPWDVAGGAIIAKEAGATLTGLEQNKFTPWQGGVLAASTQVLCEDLLQCLQNTKKSSKSS